MIHRITVCTETQRSATGTRAENGTGTHGHDEGVREAGHRVRELVRELDVVVVEPAAGDLSDTIEARDALLREQAGEQVADDAADGVRRKDLKQTDGCEHGARKRTDAAGRRTSRQSS